MLDILLRVWMLNIIKYSIFITDKICLICWRNMKLLICILLLLYFQLLEKDIHFILSISIWVHFSTHLNLLVMDYAKEYSGLVLLLLLVIILLKEVLNIPFNNLLQFTELLKKLDNYGVITISNVMELMWEVSGIQDWWDGNQIQEEVQQTMHLKCFKQQWWVRSTVVTWMKILLYRWCICRMQ